MIFQRISHKSRILQPNGDSLKFNDDLSLIRVVRAWTRILLQYSIAVIKERKQLYMQVIVQMLSYIANYRTYPSSPVGIDSA